MNKQLLWIYTLFCKVGLHQDVYGEGWISLGNGVSTEHKGMRCVWCGRIGKQGKPEELK
jgi:hypothetical protein